MVGGGCPQNAPRRKKSGFRGKVTFYVKILFFIVKSEKYAEFHENSSNYGIFRNLAKSAFYATQAGADI